jgi:group I intron endonuclease
VKNKICCIYKIENKINGKLYIGQTINYKRRTKEHRIDLNANRSHNQHLQNAWSKYGQKQFVFDILLTCKQEDLDEKEKYFIRIYFSNSGRYGYNLTDGGQNKTTVSQETRIKMGNSRRGKKHSEESKAKIGLAQKGEKNHRYGKHISESHRKKLINFFTGRKVSKETRIKISLIHKGKKLSQKTKEKISQSHIGIKASEESKKATSKSWKNGKLSKRKKAVVQTNMDGSIIGRYESARSAMRITGIKSGNICTCCQPNSKLKTAGGFIWAYENKTN